MALKGFKNCPLEAPNYNYKLLFKKHLIQINQSWNFFSVNQNLFKKLSACWLLVS